MQTLLEEPQLQIQDAGEKENTAKRLPWLGILRAALLISACVVTAFLILNVRLNKAVDARLARGPFPYSTDILASGRVLAAGDPVDREAAVHLLEKSGYTRTKGNPEGWFQISSQALEIFPGRREGEGGEGVRLEFAGGQIAAIRSLVNRSELHEYRLHPVLLANISESRERRRPVRFSEIPDSLVNAMVSIEDKHFFEHGGFDPARMLKAAYVDLRDGRKRQGASTLTMQLARILWLDREKRWGRKLQEALITIHLEHRLTKQQIFEAYANHVYLGQIGPFSIRGFGEGARAYFGKDLRQLNVAEAALLAGMVCGPSYYNPEQFPDRATARRNLVLAAMRRNGYLSGAQFRTASAAPLGTVASDENTPAGSYFIGLLNREMRNRFGEGTGRRIYTTLDPRLQQAAETAVRSGMENVDRQLRKRNRRETLPPGQPQVALVALDPRSGEIKALVGGRDYDASQLNHVLAMRQPGSVFKPFVYAAAIASAVEGGSRVFTPATLISDEPTTFYYDSQNYQPKDFHGDSMGDVTLRTALAHSLNIATVSLAQSVGYRRVVAMAQRAGLNDQIKATPSVALGAYEATPLEIAEAYTIFANRGVRVTPTTVSEIRDRDGSVLYRHAPQRVPVLDPRVAYVMVDMLQEVMRSGTGADVRARGFTLPSAGKTGTSRDGWFAGFTDDLLCVVWVGFDDNRDLNLEGARSALPIWADFMRRAYASRRAGSKHGFAPPPGVVSAEICPESGLLAGPYCMSRREVFVAGTEPVEVCSLDVHMSQQTAQANYGR